MVRPIIKYVYFPLNVWVFARCAQIAMLNLLCRRHCSPPEPPYSPRIKLCYAISPKFTLRQPQPSCCRPLPLPPIPFHRTILPPIRSSVRATGSKSKSTIPACRKSRPDSSPIWDSATPRRWLSAVTVFPNFSRRRFRPRHPTTSRLSPQAIPMATSFSTARGM